MYCLLACKYSITVLVPRSLFANFITKPVNMGKLNYNKYKSTREKLNVCIMNK